MTHKKHTTVDKPTRIQEDKWRGKIMSSNLFKLWKNTLFKIFLFTSFLPLVSNRGLALPLVCFNQTSSTAYHHRQCCHHHHQQQRNHSFIEPVDIFSKFSICFIAFLSNNTGVIGAAVATIGGSLVKSKLMKKMKYRRGFNEVKMLFSYWTGIVITLQSHQTKWKWRCSRILAKG